MSMVQMVLLSVWAQMPSGDALLEKIDANMRAENRVVEAAMTIHGRRASRTVVSISWIEGDTRSFTEYLAPAREKGVKMLKVGDQLWTYSPSTDRVIKISGHMLRQSVMGSDLSYEDMMEDNQLRNHYSAEVVGSDQLDDRPCWVLELTANEKDVAYASRKIWVDKERFVPLKEERYGKRGRLIKTTEVFDVMEVEGRWVAQRILFKDALKKGKGTEFNLRDLTFDVAISESRFSKASLRK